MTLATVKIGGEEDRLVFAWSETAGMRVTFMSADRPPVHMDLSKMDIHALMLWCQDAQILTEAEEEADG